MAAIVKFLITQLHYTPLTLTAIVILLCLLGLIVVVLNGKLLLSNSSSRIILKTILFINLLSGIALFSFCLAMVIDYNDYTSGPPYLDGFSLTYDWDRVSTLTLVSFIFHIICMKTLILCVNYNYGISNCANTKISDIFWVFVVVCLSLGEIVSRFLYFGTGSGPELYGDLKLIPNEGHFLDVLVCFIIPVVIPLVVSIRFITKFDQDEYKVHRRNIMLSLTVTITCYSVFFVDAMSKNVYYPLPSFVFSLICYSVFSVIFPILNKGDHKVYYRKLSAI